jgi:Ca2+:H+ antiporter
VAACALLGALWGRAPALPLLPLVAAALIGAVIASGASANALARATVFATVMIIRNGVVGVCPLLGATRHHVLAFRVEGTTPSLAVLATLTLVLYAVFVFVQTVRHRDHFPPVETPDEEPSQFGPTLAMASASLVLLLLARVAIVGLAKLLAPAIETAVQAAGVPHGVVGIAIALLVPVLMPETWAAARAALRNHMQSSLNLALGSALATIGLTVPVVAVAVAIAALTLDLLLQLGLPAKEIALLAPTLLVSTMTSSGGRATVLRAAVHLVLFAVFLFLAVAP